METSQANQLLKWSADRSDGFGERDYGFILVTLDGLDEDRSDAAKHYRYKVLGDEGNPSARLIYGSLLVSGGRS
jgi:hypothetical protein